MYVSKYIRYNYVLLCKILVQLVNAMDEVKVVNFNQKSALPNGSMDFKEF